MAKSRRRSRGGYTPPRQTAFNPPVWRYTARPLIGPLPPYRGSVFARRSAPRSLDHPATTRPVRYLMRTVLTDTRPRSATRSGLDVSRRAVTRSRVPINPWSADTWASSGPLYARNFTCARRSIRREVLFAIKGTSRGAGARRRHTVQSKVRC